MSQTPQSDFRAERPPADLRLCEVLDQIAALLDRHDTDLDCLSTESERLEEAATLNRLANRLLAAQVSHLNRLELDQVCSNVASLSTSSWLSATQLLTSDQASGLVLKGRDLHRFPDLERAALDGEITVGQAVAVGATLRELPDECTPEQYADAEALMLGQCATLDSKQLGTCSRLLLECIAPDTHDALEEARLEKQLARAERERYLRFRHDGHGTTLIDGSMPTEQARQVETLLGTFAAENHRRGVDRVDPFVELTSRPQRLADALVAVCERIQHCGDAPAHGGDRPRVMVTIAIDKLLDAASRGGVEVGSDHHLTPGELRRVLCDADLAPVVLGGDSEILDVGVTQRLVTRPIRTALTLRDRGCIFPGCDKLPVDCDAHHATPWTYGGPTNLSNLVLLCRHHHGLLEPRGEAGVPLPNQWRIVFDPNSGFPAVIPPPHVDPKRRRRMHFRFRTSDDPDSAPPHSAPPDEPRPAA